MTKLLDKEDIRRQWDSQGMLDCVEQFTEQCRKGEELARAFHLDPLKEIHHIVICGMGGSAIGGDLLKAYAAGECALPIEVVRNYTVPHSVGPRTLVITSSYSGETEETLSCYREAKKRGAAILAITTGGKLAVDCHKDGFPYLVIPKGYAPRAALGYSFMPLLVFFERWGLLPDQSRAIQGLYRTLETCIERYSFAVPTDSNKAKQLALTLQGNLPVIYAGQDGFQPVAARWRAQINENSKSFAHDFVIPEMNHNEILGWNHPEDLVRAFHVVFLMDKGYHKQTQKRFKVMRKILEPVASGISEETSEGQGLLARLFSLILLGDFVSVYLAFLYEQDPYPIPAIDMLKSALNAPVPAIE
ncbi:MAG: bifunctional phosphoglucose/phosphomannose isomerase [Candidatus Omnitrophica bacterium]|nr:bifunctional phosphoglucose/phosphomannose isomerase [Candidatus Omnitrophota bacterium]